MTPLKTLFRTAFEVGYTECSLEIASLIKSDRLKLRLLNHAREQREAKSAAFAATLDKDKDEPNAPPLDA